MMFTHTDFDGLVCAILFTKCYPNNQICFVDYKEGFDCKEVNEAIMTVVPDLNEEINILISDISPNLEVVEYLNQRGKVGLLDHHKTAIPLTKYPWARVVQNKCGAMLVYEMLAQRFNINDYYPLVELADTYDRWVQDDSFKFNHASKISRLIGLIGRDAFIKRFTMNSDPYRSPGNEFEALIQSDDYQMNRYIARSVQLANLFIDPLGNFVVRVVGDRYISQLGNMLLDFCPDYVGYSLVFDARETTAHLRSKDKVDVSEIAKSMGGGGHKNSAAFKVDHRNMDAFSNLLIPITKEDIDGTEDERYESEGDSKEHLPKGEGLREEETGRTDS
jgi:oligoribonuclease NrnB/cAMP/cGMP phosphodiesterase (DHH superfamily)